MTIKTFRRRPNNSVQVSGVAEFAVNLTSEKGEIIARRTAERKTGMTKPSLSLLSGTILLILLGAASALGQKGQVVEKNVEFTRGQSSATVKGVVESRLDSHVFHIRARAGQTMIVQMISARPLRDAYLCVNYPLTETGENEGVCKKRRYKIKLPRDGDYEIYIEAIRERIPYTITITVK